MSEVTTVLREDHWPDWKDSGRRVEMLLEGRRIVGKLWASDVVFDGTDEAPIFEVEADDGSKFGFDANDGWRFI